MLDTLTMARLCGWCGSVIAVLLYGFVAVAQSSPCGASSNVREVRGDLNIMSRCELNGTDVRGDVALFPGGSLIARNVEISGDLEANRADFVDIADSVVDGEVELNELVGDRSIIASSTIDGSIFLTANRSVLEILNNEVGNNIRAIGNTGGLTISGNSVEGRLECFSNSPAPVGVGNRVDRRSQGQCANLPPPTQPAPSAPNPTPTQPVPSAPNPTPITPPVSVDQTPPTITLLGAPSVSTTVGAPYTDAGATAMDSTDGDLTSRIVVTNPVNTALLGTFTITYSVSDLAGNAATPMTRTVTVAPNTAVGGGGGGALGIESWALLLLAIARAPGRVMSKRGILSRYS